MLLRPATVRPEGGSTPRYGRQNPRCPLSQVLKVETVPNGPLRVANCPSLKFGEETIPLSGDAYLCRCGQSARAPFCDGSHKAAEIGRAHV